MKFNIDRKESYSLATITQEASTTVIAIITVDLHQERTLTQQTVQLMFDDAIMSGAGKYTRAEFLSAVNLLGASVSVSIGDSILNITLRASSQNFKKLLPLVETMLMIPLFPKQELARIKSTLINELHEEKENSRSISYNELQNTFYGQNDRKFTYDIDETIERVAQIGLKDFKSLHQTLLSQPWTCSIAGESDYVEAFEKSIKKIKKANPSTKLITGIHQQKPPQKTVVLKNIPSRQNINFNIGAPLPITLHHPDYLPLAFAISVLAKWGGFTGRLMSTVREKDGLTYSIYGRLEGFSGTEQGFWRIMTFFAPDKALEGLASTYKQITKLYKEGITEAELNKFKTILGTGQILINDSVSSLLGDLHAYHSHQFTLQEMKEHKERINFITLEEINNAIRTYLDPATLTISGAGPISTVKKDIQDFIKSVG